MIGPFIKANVCIIIGDGKINRSFINIEREKYTIYMIHWEIKLQHFFVFF
jgi:hypothetical protein